MTASPETSGPRPPRLPAREVEADLVRRFKAGEEEALGRLMGLYWADLTRFAVRILDVRDCAEDVVQGAFVRLWTQRAEWKLEETLRPLLYRMVRNAALNERRRRRVLLRWPWSHSGQAADQAPTPHQEVESAEVEELVRRAIEKLPPRRREIFVLVRYHQFSQREAAEVLGLSPGTVANQVCQAARDLREALVPHLPHRDDPSTPPVTNSPLRVSYI